jgi:hypothetical protein
MYDEVRAKLQTMQGYLAQSATLQRERDRDRLQIALYFVTFVLLPAQVVLALFATSLDTWPLLRQLPPATQEWVSIVFLALMAGVGLSLFAAGGRIGRGRRRARTRPKRHRRRS